MPATCKHFRRSICAATITAATAAAIGGSGCEISMRIKDPSAVAPVAAKAGSIIGGMIGGPAGDAIGSELGWLVGTAAVGVAAHGRGRLKGTSSTNGTTATHAGSTRV